MDERMRLMFGGAGGRRGKRDRVVRTSASAARRRTSGGGATLSTDERDCASDRTAPAVVPWAITQAQGEAIIGLRRAHPSWGPKKLRAKLEQSAPSQSWPAPSTIGELLRRQQLSQPRKRRRSARPSPLPLWRGAWAQRYLVHRIPSAPSIPKTARSAIR